MSSASYAHKPLTPFRRALARFSLSETAKYVKLTLGLWIGFSIPYPLGYPEAAVALASSTMLTLGRRSTSVAGIPSSRWRRCAFIARWRSGTATRSRRA
ncbi:hypothetical protein PPMP20_27685 [Paraburkholderia phymatum]|uniref:hypothetical protein n=1 Tax=Paraburkholderia phymatum TaxID=148447 RepID=UPI0002D73EDD|nr:hypothetical protein [Paraburkholderia phymatum]